MRAAGRPTKAVAVPVALRSIVGDARAECVWRNEAGGLTFRLTAEGSLRYLKYAPDGSDLDLGAEAERLRWASPRIAVPEVVALDRSGRWLLTTGLNGESAVADRWLADPHAAVQAVGVGLRRLHDAIPAAECPFDWSVASRIAAARRLGREVPVELRSAPPIDRLVVAHGDACVPNTLLDETGAFLAHVDLGALGVADRWADLAVTAMSLGWNYDLPEGDLESELLDAYGVAPDPLRTAYYRDLWNTT